MNLKYVARKLLSVNVVLAAVALVAGIGGANAARVYLQTRVDAVEASVALRYKTSAVVVASQDLGLGEVLTSDKLALRSMPRDFLPSSALTQERINGLIGRPLVAALKKGDLLTVAVVQPLMPEALSQLLPVGKRAFTLSVDEVNSLSGLLMAGDQIDLYYTRGLSGNAASLSLLIERVPVLATGEDLSMAEGNNSGGQSQSRTFGSITVLVSADEAARLVLAQRTGTLTVVMRARTDPSATLLTSRHSDSLRPQTPGRRPTSGVETIELISGGSGGLVPERRLLLSASSR